MLSPRAIALQGLGFSVLLLAVQGLSPVVEQIEIEPVVETARHGGLRFFAPIDAEAKFRDHDVIAVAGDAFRAHGIQTSVSGAAELHRSVVEIGGGRFSASSTWQAETALDTGTVSVDGYIFKASGVWNAHAMWPSSLIDVKFGSVDCGGVINPTDDELIALLHLNDFIFRKH
jgi:hypothetical protein